MIVVLFSNKIQPHILLGFGIEHAHFHHMALLSCHGIVARICLCHTALALSRTLGLDVYLRIAWHHALVHTIICQGLAVGRPEGSAADTKFIAVYALTVDDVVAAISAAVLTDDNVITLVCNHIKVATYCICRLT